MSFVDAPLGELWRGVAMVGLPSVLTLLMFIIGSRHVTRICKENEKRERSAFDRYDELENFCRRELMDLNRQCIAVISHNTEAVNDLHRTTAKNSEVQTLLLQQILSNTGNPGK